VARVWTFKDYIADDGENVIRTWLARLPPLAKAGINTTIELLEGMDRLEMPDVKVLKGPCRGLMELRIRIESVQYRPLCWYGPGKGDVTLLVGAIEKGGRLEPLSACSTGLLRKARIEEKGRTRDHDFS
jgi:hypothetical protein